MKYKGDKRQKKITWNLNRHSLSYTDDEWWFAQIVINAIKQTFGMEFAAFEKKKPISHQKTFRLWKFYVCLSNFIFCHHVISTFISFTAKFVFHLATLRKPVYIVYHFAWKLRIQTPRTIDISVHNNSCLCNFYCPIEMIENFYRWNRASNGNTHTSWFIAQPGTCHEHLCISIDWDSFAIQRFSYILSTHLFFIANIYDILCHHFPIAFV